jgi:uncharacterized protein YdiU (UPF0061 family)
MRLRDMSDNLHPVFAFDNTYARLPERFHARVVPAPVQEPRLFFVNRTLASELGIDPDRLDAAALAGNTLPAGADPIAQAYAGHQFGAFVSRLGDGRAILLGEVVGKDGVRRDVQLKGAGRTPFSRGGDGRAALGPVLREAIVSEAMWALGVPTTRTLAAVTTGEHVQREGPLPGAVLTRVAASHIRVGTFEYFAARRDVDGLATLSAYAIARHYPDAGDGSLALLDRVVAAQADLVARWFAVGFVHGVMNTDNTTVSGETIDYGPCAFLDEYDPGKTFSSIDHGGRYAFGNQPRIALWNLARLAEALSPLLASEEKDVVRVMTEHLQRFGPRFEAAYMRTLRSKLGLTWEEGGDRKLAEDVFEHLASDAVDYTVFFRRLCDVAAAPDSGSAESRILPLFRDTDPIRDWLGRWRRRLATEDVSTEQQAGVMRQANPAFIPRNHRIEEAIRGAVQGGDFGPFETLMRVLSKPYDEQPEYAWLATPPTEEQRVRQTFCGT